MKQRVDSYISYKLAQARNYMRKARKILDEIEFLNSKIESQFYVIDDLFTIQEMYLKEEYEHRINDNDQGRGRKEIEPPLLDI